MRLRVKVCGLLDAPGVAAAVDAGVDAVGFNFHPASPRFIPPERAAPLVAMLPPGVAAVGVFVNRPRREVLAAMAASGVAWAQFHGDERPGDLADFPRPWYPAIRPGPGEDRLHADWRAPWLLVDARLPGAYGGTGETADWDAAGRLARRRRVVLAGGLGPDNLWQALQTVRPWGIDLNSGLETAPGRKDAGRLARAMALVADWRRRAPEETS